MQEPDVAQANLDRFTKIITDFITMMKIQDDPINNIIGCLRKIEAELNFFCEARDFLNVQYQRIPPALRKNEVDIETFEINLAKANKE